MGFGLSCSVNLMVIVLQVPSSTSFLCTTRFSLPTLPLPLKQYTEPTRVLLLEGRHQLSRTTRRSISNGQDFSDDDNRRDHLNDVVGRLKRRVSTISTTVQSVWNRWKTPVSHAIPQTDNDGTNDINEIPRNQVKSKTDSAPKSQGATLSLPDGPRWAVSHPTVDLSGTWKPIISADVLKQYDEYLTNCGTSYIFRQMCLKFCSTTRESITQLDDGRVLELDGITPAGSWKRALVSSGAEVFINDYNVQYAEFLDPDKELVQVEAWWEEQGSVHRSILRNKPKVDGGTFETLRYLIDGVDDDATASVTLVTESFFRPETSSNGKFKPAHVRWMYTRVTN